MRTRGTPYGAVTPGPAAMEAVEAVEGRVTRRTTVAAAAAVLGAGVLGSAGAAGARDTVPILGPATAPDLHLMTWNVRAPQPGTLPGQADHWQDRAPLVTRLLADEQPTLLAVQEATSVQLGAITDALPHHHLLGFGYGAETLAGYPFLAYDDRRLALLRWDQHALSATPGVVDSVGWGNRFPRSLTWARLRDRATGRELALVVTHLDHESEHARVASARLVAEEVGTFDCPVLVAGDFNADAAESVPYAVLTGAGLRDAWTSARHRLTRRWGTFPGYGDPVVGERRIDWLLTSGGIAVDRVAINTTTYRTGWGERWPSDHTPVQALLRIG